jgi:hypothetical protein
VSVAICLVLWLVWLGLVIFQSPWEFFASLCNFLQCTAIKDFPVKNIPQKQALGIDT